MQKMELVENLKAARASLLDAQHRMETIHRLARAIDGDHEHLVLMAVLPPTPSQPITMLSAWLERVDHFIHAAESQQ